MRYLVKTHLGSLAAGTNCTALDLLWYDFNSFGFQSSALSGSDKRMISISGYNIESVEPDSDEKQYFSKVDNGLFGDGLSKTVWHDKEWDNSTVLPSWSDTNYFYGMTHESIDSADLKNVLHPYHRYDYETIMSRVSDGNDYMSSVILWLWDLKDNNDNIFSTAYTDVEKSSDDEIGFVSTSRIAYTGITERFRYAAYTNLYDSIKQFSIYTVECSPSTDAARNSLIQDSNKNSYQSIKINFGSVRRSFSKSYGYDKIGADDIPWNDGMCLDNWSMHDSLSPISIFAPKDSKIVFGRATNNFERTEGSSTIYSTAYTFLSNLNSGANSSIAIYATTNDYDDQAAAQSWNLCSSRFIRSRYILLRPFFINDESGTAINDNYSRSTVDKFCSDEDIASCDQHGWITDTAGFWYQIPII